MSEIRPDEIVIEIDQEEIRHMPPIYGRDGRVLEERDPVRVGNNNYYFFPVDKSLRSGFRPVRCGSPPTALLNLDYIPGQRIHLNVAAREGRITDALGDKANEALYARVGRAWRQLEIIGPMGQPIPDEVVGLRTDDSFYTWMYWMRRCLDGNPPHERYAREIQNCHQLWSLEQIIKTGKVKLPIYEPDVKSAIKGNYLTPELAGIGAEGGEYQYRQEG